MKTGVVAIGRNEGERLKRCLESVMDHAEIVIYVDSGSTDGSVEWAKGRGAVVVELDRSVPFTAARARNAGFAKLSALKPDLDWVQFVDGDCEVVSGWLEAAEARLSQDAELAVVCGRRRERYPDKSVYNLLCDFEWDTPVGIAEACGGDAMMRITALQAVDAYDAELIAGEEPELCLRLRRRGFRVERLGVEMTLHDAAMSTFYQWWKRSQRAGHAYAEGSAKHGNGPERYWVRQTRSNWAWGLGLPLVSAILAVPTRGASLLLPLGYGTLWLRMFRSFRARPLSAPNAAIYASFCVMGKFPQAFGQASYWFGRLTGRRSKLIEYKHAG